MRRLVDEMLLLASLDRGKAALAEGVSRRRRASPRRGADRRRGGRSAGATWTIEAASRGLAVPVAPRLLEVVIGNLVDNALRHAGAMPRWR